MNLVIQKRGLHQYVSLRESYWDPVRRKYTSRTIENFGRLDLLLEKDPNILETLRARAEDSKKSKLADREAALEQKISKLTKAGPSPQSFDDNPTVMIGPCVFWQLWVKLGMPRRLREIQHEGKTRFYFPAAAFYLTAARILMPDSKLAQWNGRNQFLYGCSGMKLEHFYRTIDLLIAHKNKIVKYLNAQIKKVYDRKVTAALYDVTTYWFESQDSDTLRNFGFSKDCRVNQVQVVMGLVIDQNGIPIDYELYPGNTSEFGTMIPLIKQLKEVYGIRKIVVTADRGLNSGSNLLALKELGLDYVIAFRLRNAGAEIRKLIQDQEGWISRSADRLPDVSKYRLATETRRVRQNDPETGRPVFVNVTSQLLISYSARRARKDRHDRQRLLDKAQRYGNNPGLLKSDLRRGGKSFLKISDDPIDVRLDAEKVRQAELFDGYYGIVYSDKTMPVEKVLGIYHSLWQIEESFRISKSILEARPCFHWAERRIRGHFFICFMALVLHRLLEKEIADSGVHLTADAIVDSLRDARLTEYLSPGGQKFYGKSSTKGDFATIAKIVGLGDLPRCATSAEVRKALRIRNL